MPSIDQLLDAERAALAQPANEVAEHMRSVASLVRSGNFANALAHVASAQRIIVAFEAKLKRAEAIEAEGVAAYKAAVDAAKKRQE